METAEIEKLQRYLKRHKYVLYVIVGFLALLTYLLIVVAGQVSREQAFQGQSKAFDGGLTNYGDGDQQQGGGQFETGGATIYNSAPICGTDPTETEECQCKVVEDPYNPPRSCGPLGFSGYIKYQCPGDPNVKSIYVNCQSKECYTKKIASMDNPYCPEKPSAGGLQAPSLTPTPGPSITPSPTPIPGSCKARLANGNPDPAPGNGQCAIYSNPNKRYAELCFSCPNEPANTCDHTVSATEIKSTDGSGKCYIDQYTRKKVCYKTCATFDELQERANEKCKNMKACPRN